MTGWKRVYFDLDNTLFDYEQAFERASKQVFSQWVKSVPSFDRSVDDWFGQFKEACDRLWSAYEAGYLQRESYQFQRFQQSLRPFQLDISKEDALQFDNEFKSILPRFITPFDGVYELLNRLKRDQYELGIISNGDPKLQLKKINQLNLEYWIQKDSIKVSNNPGKAKPHQYLFRSVTGDNPLQAKQSVYIGDSWELDVCGALGAGWDAIYLNTLGEPVQKCIPHVPCVASIHGLLLNYPQIFIKH